MDSTVEFEDLDTGEIEKYTITFPDRADVDAGRMSVLAPIGTALIGCRVGSTVKWSTPGGIRQLKIRRVTSPAKAAADIASPALSFAGPAW
jgi:regulator of nucleoside diphosphate kinase